MNVEALIEKYERLQGPTAEASLSRLAQAYITAKHNKLTRRGFNLLPVISGVRKIVNDLHAGKLVDSNPAPQRQNLWRWTPSFMPRMKPANDPQAKPFTASSIARLVGLTKSAGRHQGLKAQPAIDVALHVLELEEKGLINATEIAALCSGGFSLKEIIRLCPSQELQDARAQAFAVDILKD